VNLVRGYEDVVFDNLPSLGPQKAYSMAIDVLSASQIGDGAEQVIELAGCRWRPRLSASL
jgi:hypothetical protein